MTEQHFPCPIQSFSLGCIPAPLGGPIDILAEGRSALEKANQELGEQEGPGQASRGAESHSQLFWWLSPRSGPRLLGPGFLHQALSGAAAEPQHCGGLRLGSVQ